MQDATSVATLCDPGASSGCQGIGKQQKRRIDSRLASRPGRRLGLGGKQTFALGPLASEFARSADGFGPLTRFFLRRLFVMSAQLHFAENAFALHLFLQRFKGLINVVVTNEDLHAVFLDLVPLRLIGAGRASQCDRQRNAALAALTLKVHCER
jgi:hypothetical protein